MRKQLFVEMRLWNIWSVSNHAFELKFLSKASKNFIQLSQDKACIILIENILV